MSPQRSSANLPGMSLLEQMPIIMEKILLDVPDSTMAWKPAADRWSISEVLGHLSDIEQCWRERIKRMAQEDSPALESYDQNASYAAGKYAGSGRENLRKFCHERDRSLSLLRYLPEGALGRSGQHAELGRVTISDQLHSWAFHDLGHIKQISEIYRAGSFYTRMGPFKGYYTVKP
jgi:DinB family protein